jgi:hypothetical protein
MARPWSVGYMPSNERSTVVILSLDPTKQRIREEPRLVRLSGDTKFDQAALEAARTGLQQWLLAGGFESLAQTSSMPAKEVVRPEEPLSPFKVRAQFQLHQDVPALNLIAPHALDHSVTPLRRPPALQ